MRLPFPEDLGSSKSSPVGDAAEVEGVGELGESVPQACYSRGMGRMR